MYIARERKVTCTSCNGFIHATGQVDLLATDKDLGHLGGIKGSHHDTGRELIATHDGLRVGNDKRIEGIDTNILDVNVLNQCVQHLTLGIADIVLQFGKQRDSSCCRHRLKHVFLPVLTHRLGILGNLGSQVRGYHLLLAIAADHLQHFDTIGIDGIKQFPATSASGSQHHLIGSLQVLLVANVQHITVLAVGFLYNRQLQLVSQIVEGITHLPDLL